MLVHRLTFYVKPGSAGKAIEMMRESQTIFDVPHGLLIYAPYHSGEDNVVTADVKFENLTELEEWWAKWTSHPDFPAFIQRWFELQERSGKRDILNLVE